MNLQRSQKKEGDLLNKMILTLNVKKFRLTTNNKMNYEKRLTLEKLKKQLKKLLLSDSKYELTNK